MIGRATRLAQFLSADDKDYDADDPASGSRPTPTTPRRSRSHERGIRPAPAGGSAGGRRTGRARGADGFRGTYLQMPPAFSAKKVGGTPAYMLARQQQADVELKAGPGHGPRARADRLRGRAGDGAGRLLGGFYVRSLAHDLGERLGCGAHLEALRRTRAGEFRRGPGGAAGGDRRTRARQRAGAADAARAPAVPPARTWSSNERGARRARPRERPGRRTTCRDADRPIPADATRRAGPASLDAGGALLAIGRAGRRRPFASGRCPGVKY